MEKMPDFLIIGAPKSGTTALYFYLLQHPQIFLPTKKEPFFFAFDEKQAGDLHPESITNGLRNAILDLGQYQSLFDDVPLGAVKGEASTIYLSSPDAPEKIYQYIPNVKMIAILRNPVDRAYSQYLHFRRDKYEPCSTFQEAIHQETTRIEQNWFQSFHYINTGFYAKHLQRYYEKFSKDQVRVFLYEDLHDSQSLMTEIFTFLDVSQQVTINTTTKHNQSGTPRSSWLYQSLRQSTKMKTALRKILPVKVWSEIRSSWENLIIQKPKPMPDSTRTYLKSIYKKDILDLQELLNRDLGSWMNQV